MPLQTLDFLNARTKVPEYDAIGSALPDFLKGYQISKEPAKMAEEQRKAELANALSQLELQYKPEDYQTQFDLRRAQAQHARQAGNSAASLQGHARNISDLNKIMNDPNIPPEYKAMALELFKTDIAKGQSLVGTREQNMQYKPWSSLGTNDQNRISSQYAAMGIGAQDALELYTHKVTPELLAAYKQQNPGASMHEAVAAVVGQIQGGHGYGLPQEQSYQNQFGQPQNTDVQNPMMQTPGQQNTTPPLQPVDTRTLPIQPAMTGENTTKYNELQGNIAESDYLGKWVTEHNAPYSQFPGVKDAWVSLTKRKDPAAMKERHEYLAAQMMGPDASLLNIKLAGGSTARDAIHDLERRMKLEAKNMGITITPEDYRQATRIMHEVLERGARLRGQAMAGQIAPGFEQTIQHAQQQNTTGAMAVGITPDGRRVNVPADKLDGFISKGGKRG